MNMDDDRRSEDSLVRYTVKELLAQMFSKLDSIDAKLDAKADRTELMLMIPRVERLEEWGVGYKASEQYRQTLIDEHRLMVKQIRHLEQMAITQETIDHYRRWLLSGAGLGFLSVTISIAVSIQRLF